MNQSTSYLITGGAGFLGINLIRYLLARGHAVTSLDVADFDYPERDRVTVVFYDLATNRSTEPEDSVREQLQAAAVPSV